jgi:hypothetical protein
MQCERLDLESRFRALVAHSRRELLIFAAGGAVLSLAMWFGGIALLYMAVVYLFGVGPPLGPFAAASGLLFLILGWLQHRSGSRSPALSDQLVEWSGRTPIFSSRSRMAFYSRELSGGLVLLWYLATFPGFIVHFLAELAGGRHLRGGEDVERLALRLLAEGGDRISREHLRALMEAEPAATRRAVELLLELRLLAPVRGDAERPLRRTLRGEELLESASSAS